ncbi:hypothetical protein EVAR_38468_1 [Eumeta japonica]|uniref:Uncharacterized protein n=1 Tax=Eumeta variegata TaxID=151549 RepID=A0A4C1WP71_EUMVA|nr:hypothetical protein EVAR_38468_1 [Eumeta japonica]
MVPSFIMMKPYGRRHFLQESEQLMPPRNYVMIQPLRELGNILLSEVKRSVHQDNALGRKHGASIEWLPGIKTIYAALVCPGRRKLLGAFPRSR